MQRTALRAAADAEHYTTRTMFAERYPQPEGARGSLRWIQALVGDKPALLTDAVREVGGRPGEWTVDWVSPRREDEWAEYRDAGFLKLLRLPHLIDELPRVWPRGGPQWDALGVASDGTRVLVEAKAHVAELQSTCGAGADSLALIGRTLDATKASWGVAHDRDWLSPYYQYANRIAHLEFLRTREVPTMLLFVYFVGDQEMAGPRSADEWRTALNDVYDRLGLTGDLGARGVANAFISVEHLSVVV
jgi:hypothetical protein